METKELFISEGVTQILAIGEEFLRGGSYAITAHVAKNASLTVTEAIQTTAPCTIRFTAILEGEGASVVDRSRYQGLGNAMLDIERVVVHAAPATSSHVDARGVLCDAARVLWRGRIVVERNAKKAQAFQRHDAMVTSADAFVDAAPFLEIFTNDVSCKHAVSIQRMRPEHLFYMESRGVSKEGARTMALEGFLSDCAMPGFAQPILS